jgi:hypothetical protein
MVGFQVKENWKTGAGAVESGLKVFGIVISYSEQSQLRDFFKWDTFFTQKI